MQLLADPSVLREALIGNLSKVPDGMLAGKGDLGVSLNPLAGQACGILCRTVFLTETLSKFSATRFLLKALEAHSGWLEAAGLSEETRESTKRICGIGSIMGFMGKVDVSTLESWRMCKMGLA